jgi:hypothetical protein
MAGACSTRLAATRRGSPAKTKNPRGECRRAQYDQSHFAG